MELTSIRYSEFRGKENEWNLEELSLGKINLLVGKNATGKSRTVSLINSLAKLLSGQLKEVFIDVSYEAHFRDGNDTYLYAMESDNYLVTREDLEKNGENVLHRGLGGVGKIFMEDIDGQRVKVRFQTPARELGAVVRRDEIQHPFLQRLYDWGSGVRGFEFGKTMGHPNLAVAVKGPKIEVDDRDTSQIVPVFNAGMQQFPDAFQASIIADMAELGYDIESFKLRQAPTVVVHSIVPAEVVGIAAKERDLRGMTDQHTMSQGMFRALALIIYLNYASMAKRGDCILVDDIGEGLDFDRSCKLIELLRRKAKASSLQLIMSTNDRFVMNKVPLDEWCILQRQGGTVRVRNYENSRAAFDRFKITGLSNFDLLATDYIQKVAPHG